MDMMTPFDTVDQLSLFDSAEASVSASRVIPLGELLLEGLIWTLVREN